MKKTRVRETKAGHEKGGGESMCLDCILFCPTRTGCLIHVPSGSLLVQSVMLWMIRMYVFTPTTCSAFYVAPSHESFCNGSSPIGVFLVQPWGKCRWTCTPMLSFTSCTTRCWPCPETDIKGRFGHVRVIMWNACGIWWRKWMKRWKDSIAKGSCGPFTLLREWIGTRQWKCLWYERVTPVILQYVHIGWRAHSKCEGYAPEQREYWVDDSSSLPTSNVF